MAGMPLLKRAVEIDPNFALAHSTLGREYADLDESDLSAGAPPGRGSCGTMPANGKSSSSLLPTKALQREIWKRRGRTMRHGRKPILVTRCPTRCCRAIQTRQRGDTNRLSRKGERRSELDPDFAIAYYNLAVNNVYLVAWTRLRTFFGARPGEDSKSTNSSCWSTTSPS